MTDSTNEQGPAVSGVIFKQTEGTTVEVEARFLDAGAQIQQVFVGLEPVLVVQPEYEADEDKLTYVLTGVNLTPISLEVVLTQLLDVAKHMAAEERQQIAEYQAAQAANQVSVEQH